MSKEQRRDLGKRGSAARNASLTLEQKREFARNFTRLTVEQRRARSVAAAERCRTNPELMKAKQENMRRVNEGRLRTMTRGTGRVAVRRQRAKRIEMAMRVYLDCGGTDPRRAVTIVLPSSGGDVWVHDASGLRLGIGRFSSAVWARKAIEDAARKVLAERAGLLR
jgi:hypothetical protein